MSTAWFDLTVSTDVHQLKCAFLILTFSTGVASTQMCFSHMIVSIIHPDARLRQSRNTLRLGFDVSLVSMSVNVNKANGPTPQYAIENV